ncbi:50S ribosomal protein L10 [Thermodesulfobacteriota bacterium]
MTRDEKKKQVEWFREKFQSARALIMTDYKGLSVGEMTELRAALRPHGVNFKVIKNTLVRLAYQDTDLAVIDEFVVGPRAAAWTDDEDQAPAMAKALVDFAKAHDNLEVICGAMGGNVLSSADVDSLSKLPPREQLMGMVLGTMIAPVGSFVNTLAAIPRSFLNVLKAIEEQKNNSAEPAV